MENLELAKDLLFVAFGLFIGYVIVSGGKWKADKSVSNTKYSLQYPWKWVFTVNMLAISVLVGYAGYLLEYHTLMSSSVGLALVGIFSRFKRNIVVKILHTGGAFYAFGAMLLSIWLDFGHLWWCVGALISAIAFWAITGWNKTVIWNMEIVGVFIIFYTYIFLL